ncbi:MAG: hypothetical protein DMF93_19095 [Acidobacteria bacterium]|nr:MAG: hypothetical protein DMF93_19095 [Acidobacteriota bacterium]
MCGDLHDRRSTYAVAASQLRRRLLRDGAAVHQRRRAHLALQRRRRRDDAVLRPRARAAHSGARDAVDGDRDHRRRFAPDNESSFKRVVLVEDPRRGYAIGFQTREFIVDRGRGPEPLLAVYVPTNNLYLGDVLIVERARALFPDISVEDGIRIFLTGGMALPPKVRL